MRQKENYKVRHHFYNTITTSNSPQTPKKTKTEWLMSKPQERKEGLRVTRPSSLSSRAKTPVLSVKSFTLTAGRGCVEVKSPWVPQLRTHTHTHTNSIDVLGFRLLFIFYTHFLHSQTQTVQPSMWFFKGSCACWTTPFKMYRNANIWLSSGIKDLLDTRPLFITLSLHNHCAQGTISAVRIHGRADENVR